MSAVCPLCAGPLEPNTAHDSQADCDAAQGPTELFRANHPPIVPRGTSTLCELLLVPIDRVATESNVRADLGDLDELAASIRSEGLLQPIMVHRKYDLGTANPVYLYVVDHGHRRLEACKLAGMTEIPVIVSEPRAGVDRPIAQLVENLQRRDLNPLEEAEAFWAILDADPKLKQADLAGRIGRSAPYVSNALRILELEPAVRQLAEQGALSGAHAKALAGLKGKAQVEMAERAVRSNYSSHALEDEIARNRKYAEETRAREAKDAEAVAEQYVKAAAALAKKKVPLDAPIFVEKSYGTPAGPMLTAAAKAGYTNVTEGRCDSRAGTLGCDCVVWVIELGYGKPKVMPGRQNHAHRQARIDVDTAERLAGDELLKHVRARLEEVLLTDAQQTSRLVGRLALWLALSWRVEDWAKKWNAGVRRNLPLMESLAVLDQPPAKKVKRTAWQTIASLTDDQLSQELAHAMATELRDQAGYPVDWQGLEAELTPPAPDVRTTTEVQADVATKRAARRATAWDCPCGQKNAAWATECGRCAATRQAVPV
jgi:ParB family chromosome partitioning protein